MVATQKRTLPAAAAAADDARACRTKPTTAAVIPRVVAFLRAYDFVAARILPMLGTHELGAFSTTTRDLRYGSAIGDAFYSTCTLCVPESLLGQSTFIDRMHPSAVALVTRVRLPHVQYVKRATPFVNAKVLLVDKHGVLPVGNPVFPRLEQCSVPYPGVACVANLSHLRSLQLHTTTLGDDWTPLEALPQLEKMELWHMTGDTMAKLNAAPTLTELVMHDTWFCEDLRCLPVLPQLKTLVLRAGEVCSLAGLERQQSIVQVELCDSRIDDLGPLAALRQLRTFRNMGAQYEQVLAPLADHLSLKELFFRHCVVRGLDLLQSLPRLEALWVEDVVAFDEPNDDDWPLRLDHVTDLTWKQVTEMDSSPFPVPQQLPRLQTLRVSERPPSRLLDQVVGTLRELHVEYNDADVLEVVPCPEAGRLERRIVSRSALAMPSNLTSLHLKNNSPH